MVVQPSAPAARGAQIIHEMRFASRRKADKGCRRTGHSTAIAAVGFHAPALPALTQASHLKLFIRHVFAHVMHEREDRASYGALVAEDVAIMEESPQAGPLIGMIAK